jgi:hypothetical protein
VIAGFVGIGADIGEGMFKSFIATSGSLPIRKSNRITAYPRQPGCFAMKPVAFRPSLSRRLAFSWM